MADDINIIKQIEKQIGKTLELLPLKDIWLKNGYALDDTGEVKGLNLDYRGINDISFLKDLNSLIILSLCNNQLTDLTPLSALTSLTKLWLYNNQIADLTPLSALTNLTELRLSDNKLTDLTPLSALTNLTLLNLGANQLTERHLTPLSALTNLTELNLGDNKLTDVTPLSALTNLTWLNLGANQLTERHLTLLSALTNLTELWISDNQIKDLTPLSALTNLAELYLVSNQLTDLTPLRKLKHLIALDVRNNRIPQLPPDITSWWPGMEIKWEDSYFFEGLNLYGNPLTDPPVEIVKKGKKAVENYFTEIQKASVHFLECKLLLVGSGDVGKTTLMKKLKNNRCKVTPGKEDTTRGIDIQPWKLSCPFPDGHSHDVNIHFWDFGGQDILHATHQFFLTKRSLYLFVWDPRKEEETRSFDYWLNAVKLFGAGSPLIMVMNKADIRIKHIDEASFQDKFPNITQFHQVSCVTGHHIPELTETLRNSLCGMPHLLDKLPKRWMDIRAKLKAHKDNYISLDDYFAICHDHNMDKEKALFLSDYLHDLGIILHFSQDPVLAGTVILKPEWATGAVYALIDSLEIQKNKGRFSRAHLRRYWDKKKYPEEKYPQLLRLIEKFELCFNIVGTDDYILPELLPSQRPVMDMAAYQSTSGGNLQLHYSYDFMPAGIITRFISRIHYLIREDHYWNNGVELEFSGSTALVVSDAAQKRIRISTAGSNNTQLMGIIRSHFDHIHETLNMKKEKQVFEEVPCNCSECLQTGEPHFYKYHVLQKFLSKGIGVACEKSAEAVSIPQLIHGLLPPKEPGNLFDIFITTLSQVQGIKKTLQTDENSRNTVVALLLRTRGFHALDQTLHGSSASGLKLGELDIKIEDETARTISIIEALNLDFLNKTLIDRHIRKLFIDYDPSGVKENYILVYSSAKDFGDLCGKYGDHLQQIDYGTYPLVKNGIEEVKTSFNKITAFRARHKCNNGETILYHLLVEM